MREELAESGKVKRSPGRRESAAHLEAFSLLTREHVASFAAIGSSEAAAIETRPPHQRMEIFTHVLTQVQQLLPHQRGPVLEMLAYEIPVLPHDDERTRACDDVLAALRQIPTTSQPFPAAILFNAFGSLPLGEAQHARYVDAFDFVRAMPIDHRTPPLEALTDKIWRHSDPSSQLDSLDELMSLQKSEPLAARVKIFASLYQVNLDGAVKPFRFAVLRKLFREVQQLPDAAQGMLIGDVAAQALRSDRPICAITSTAFSGTPARCRQPTKSPCGKNCPWRSGQPFTA